MNLNELFAYLKTLPVGFIIDNPHLKVPTLFKLNPKVKKIIASIGDVVHFTMISLKHIAEKGDLGEYLFFKIKEILECPDFVHTGNFNNRFLISKKVFTGSKLKPHVVTLEITQSDENIIVTCFIAKDKYFKSLELLWGTTSSPSQQFLKE